MEADSKAPFPRYARFYLTQHGSLDSNAYGFHTPMFAGIPETLTALKTELENSAHGQIHFKRTLESGSVEEYVVFSLQGVKKKLLFRVWPVFYTHNKRLEYKIHESDKRLRALITEHLQRLAQANRAALREK